MAFLVAGLWLWHESRSSISILNFGDVMLDRGVRGAMESKGLDPFGHIKEDSRIINKFDVVIANLEGPIIEMDRSLCQQKIYNFQFASDTPVLLEEAGITMVNIANNHAYDCYKKGFESTKTYLKEAGIDYMGDTELEKSFIIKKINGKTVAFVGMDQTIAIIPISKFYPLIKKLKSQNDYVVVDIHWGTEYEPVQTAVQTAIGHALVDNGADVVFGHHPHVVEPVEVYKSKVIFYSLGNFVFDQVNTYQKQGIGAGVEFTNNGNTFSIFPFEIKSFAPDLLEGAEKEKYCDTYLKDLEHSGCSFLIR